MNFLKDCLLNQPHEALYFFLDLCDHCNFTSTAYFELKYDFYDHSIEEIVDLIFSDLIKNKFHLYENNKMVIMFIHLYYKIVLRRYVNELKYSTGNKELLFPIMDAILSDNVFVEHFKYLDVENLKKNVGEYFGGGPEDMFVEDFVEGYYMIVDHLNTKQFDTKIVYTLEYLM